MQIIFQNCVRITGYQTDGLGFRYKYIIKDSEKTGYVDVLLSSEYGLHNLGEISVDKMEKIKKCVFARIAEKVKFDYIAKKRAIPLTIEYIEGEDFAKISLNGPEKHWEGYLLE